MEKVSCFPNEGTPQVLSGPIQDGDIVRVTLPSGGVAYQRYSSPPGPPTANTPNNPYFPGWRPKTQLGFWGLVQGVFIALGGSNEAGADRFARLVTDTRARGIVEMIRATDVVDPDDKDGAFLRALTFLTRTNAASDGLPLITAVEAGAIMQKTNWA